MRELKEGKGSHLVSWEVAGKLLNWGVGARKFKVTGQSPIG